MRATSSVLTVILGMTIALPLLGVPAVPVARGQEILPASTPPALHAKEVPAGTPEQVRDAVLHLEQFVGYDRDRDVLTLPYREKAVEALVEALASPVPEVQLSALQLLSLAVRQPDLPGEVLHQRIVPAVRGILEGSRPEGSPEKVRALELARRVLWHAEIRALTHPGQRVEALAAALHNRQDGYYYPIEALAYLAEMGSLEVHEVLEGVLSENERQRLSPKLVARVRTTLTKVELKMRLRGLPPEAQVTTLRESLVASLPDLSLPARDFQTWALREIGARRGEEAKRALSQLATDGTLRPDLRYEAEQELRQLSEPLPARPQPPAR
jgi:hypothetical protein